MRDIAVTLLILGLIPVILRYPWTGVLVSAWVSIFSPHRWAYGFALNFPFAQVVLVVTVIAMLLRLSEVRLHFNGTLLLMILLPLWMTVTLGFALEPVDAYVQWERVMKMFVFVFMAAALLHSRKHLEGMLWVLVLSVGFYGVKGGIFTIVSGGGEKVFGPPGESYISDNNAISVALVMTIPLMYYLAGVTSSKWVRWGVYGTVSLSGMAVLGSQSRGALLAVLAMLMFFWLKSRKKLLLAFVLVALVPLAIGFMPKSWTERMKTVETYETDDSAMGRINTWKMAFNLANDRPIMGGGFELYSPRTFRTYAPNPLDIHAAHSIYFQMLGEHGYVGLALFLWFGIASWSLARRTIKASRNRADCVWAGDLARAIQVSLIGFAVGGAFVNISYWELQYYEVVILMAAYRLVSAVEPKAVQRGIERKPNPAVT